MNIELDEYKRGLFTLRYQNRDIEHDYLDSISYAKKMQMLFTMGLTFFLYIAYISVDIYVLSEQEQSIALPFHISMLFLWVYLIPSIYYGVYKKFAMFILYLMPIYAILGTIVVAYFGNSLYVTEIYVILFWSFVAIGYMFLESVVISSIMVLFSASLTYILEIIDFQHYVIHIFFMLAAWTLGLLAAYIIELYSRKNYEQKMQILLIQNELKESIGKVEYLNENLEYRVEQEIQKNRVTQEQLQRQLRMAQMGEMISMIAHQWRQPLGAISASSIDLQIKIELGRFDLDTKEGQDKQNLYFLDRLDKIGKLVGNLTLTIDDFRNFYKPNKKSVVSSFEEVVNKSLNIINASLLDNKIELIKEYNSDMHLEMYESEMMQVILNILKNAQDNFSEKAVIEPRIVIRTQDNTLSIHDNGGGVSDEMIEKIFDPYFSTKDELNGTGLGLYMSKTIILEHHNGELSVENRDGGACFTVSLNKKLKKQSLLA